MTTNMEVKIDYFSATFPLQCDEQDSILFKVHEMVRCIATYLNVKNYEIVRTKYAQNKYETIDKFKDKPGFTVDFLCKILEIPRSSYYKWKIELFLKKRFKIMNYLKQAHIVSKVYNVEVPSLPLQGQKNRVTI